MAVKPKTKEIVAKDQKPNISLFEGESSGFEGTDASTFKTPFLKILQTLSPELKRSDPKYIPDAEVGYFCNTGSQELYDEINVIVLKVEHSLLVWKPNRGGFMGRYKKDEESEITAKKDGVKKWDSEGNIVMDTIEFFCLNADEPSDVFILSLSAASFKHGRSFATRLRMLKLDGKLVNKSWAGVWKISTVEESNEKGSWYTVGSTPEFVRWVTKEERDKFILPTKKMLETAETDYSSLESELVDEENNSDTSFEDDEDLPF